MVKKLTILNIILSVFFTCISCTSKDTAVQSLYSGSNKLKASLPLTPTNPQLNTEAALLLQISNDQNKLLIISLIITIACAAITYYIMNAKRKKELFMEGYAIEARLSKKLHDEIANEIYGAINLIRSDKAMHGTSKEKIIAQLDSIYETVRNLSSETNTVYTGSLYPEHLRSMLTGYTSNNTNIITKGLNEIRWNNIHPAKKIATYRSLQELMVNMKKHSSATIVVIDFIQKQKKIEIRYSDNGCGISDEKLLTKNGLLNIENRMNAINGNMIFDNSNNTGLHLILTYPQYTPHVQKNLNNRRHRQY